MCVNGDALIDICYGHHHEGILTTLALDTCNYSVFIIITVIMNMHRSSNICTYVTVVFIHKENNNITHNIIVYSRLEVGVLQYLYFSMLTKLNTINYENLN